MTFLEHHILCDSRRVALITAIRILLLVFASKSTQPKALNYIPTSCSRATFLILVTFLNLAVIHVHGDIHFILQHLSLLFFIYSTSSLPLSLHIHHAPSSLPSLHPFHTNLPPSPLFILSMQTSLPPLS